MKKSTKLTLGVLGLTATIIGLLWCSGTLSIWQRQWVWGRAMPAVGSSRAQVERWMQGRGMEIYDSQDLTNTGGYPALDSFQAVSGLPPTDTRLVVYGSEEVGPVWRGWLWAYFSFGPDGRLVKTTIRYWPAYF
jgi:hypothetical protein